VHKRREHAHPVIPDTLKRRAEKAIILARTNPVGPPHKEQLKQKNTLKQAETAFAKENYGQAKELAQQAKQLAENAPILKEKEPQRRHQPPINRQQR